MSFDPYSEGGNKIIQQWMRDFDELYKKQKQYLSPIKYVTIDGNKMTIEDFLNYKLRAINKY